jgi:hypothetical protein
MRSLFSLFCSLHSFLGAPCCALCVLVTTVLAGRVVLLDDTFVAFENSRSSVEVNVPPFVLGGNSHLRFIPSLRYRAFLVTCHRTIVFPLDNFSFAMDVEVALPSGNIGDEPEACGNTLEGYNCAAPEYVMGKKGSGWRMGEGAWCF